MFHLQIRRVSRGTKNAATDRLTYIQRTQRYARRGDIVRHTRSINMPDWVMGLCGEDYWREADSSRMRINGRLLYTVEVALPRRLSLADQDALAMNFARLVSRMSVGRHDKSNLPCTYAVHEGARANDATTGRLPNPHAHLLISPSINDGVLRPREQWFRRSSRNDPSSGGAPRSEHIGTMRWLLKLRKAWARIANAALMRAGFPASLDHRSHRSRGLLAKPSIHIGPKGSHLAREGTDTWRVRRNIRIGAMNTVLHALDVERAYKLKNALQDEELLAIELKLERDHKHAMAHLQVELALHPLAVEQDDPMSAATAMVFTFDLSHPAGQMEGPGFERSLAHVQRMVGGGWLAARIGKRVWLLHPPSDDVVVLGPGFVATDSADDEFLARFAAVVRTLKFGALYGTVRPHVWARVDLAMRGEGVDCTWVSVPLKGVGAMLKP